jgi:hypothetical protein
MWKAILLLGATSLAARGRIAFIDFYGAKGLDTEAVRRALPAHEGDPYARFTKRAFRDAALSVTGRGATEVAAICCDPNGDTYLFIGLPGQSWKNFTTNPPPTGAVRLGPALIDLQHRIEVAGEAATRAGSDAATEDDSLGYALSHDPAERALQLQLRVYAVKHERELLRVAAESSDAHHREAAVIALGYARQSPRQLAALVHASCDPNEDVRNGAGRRRRAAISLSGSPRNLRAMICSNVSRSGSRYTRYPASGGRASAVPRDRSGEVP